MSRRGFGNIRRLQSGRYQARYRTLDGQECKAPQTFPTKRDANDFLATVQADLLRGEWRNPRHGAITFAEWSETYLAAAVHKRNSTLAQDRSVLRRHLLPAFGPMSLSSITPMHVRNFIGGLGDQGLQAATIRSVAVKLRAILNAAVSADLIVRSPFRDIKLPRNRATDIRILTPDELHQLAAAMDQKYRPMVYLAGTLGMRFGEMAGLRVGRLDLLRSRLSVLETATPQGEFTEPKSPASRRTLQIPGFLNAMLAEHLHRQGLTATDGRSLVFAAPRGGRLFEANWHRRYWKPALEATAFSGLTPHALRHSAAATMIQLGAHPKAIQERLGHENIRTTLDVYGHIFDHVDTELTDKLEAHFGAPDQSVRHTGGAG